ncbi:hypothetical protein ACFL6C_13585 [Myxococcota bacterium]
MAGTVEKPGANVDAGNNIRLDQSNVSKSSSSNDDWNDVVYPSFDAAQQHKKDRASEEASDERRKQALERMGPNCVYIRDLRPHKTPELNPGPKKIADLDVAPDVMKVLKSCESKTRLAGNRNDETALSALANHPVFLSLSSKDQLVLLGVFSVAPSEGRTALVWLLMREVHGRRALLSNDCSGTRLLDHLRTWTRQAETGELARGDVSRGQYMAGVLKIIGRPGLMDQGTKGTCSVTSLSYLLNHINPAELTRILIGLGSPEGKVALADGSLIYRAKGQSSRMAVVGPAAGDSSTPRSWISAMAAPSSMTTSWTGV